MRQILGNIVIADAGRKCRPAWQQMKGVSLLKQSESGRYSNKRALEQVWKAKQASGSNINRYHLLSIHCLLGAVPITFFSPSLLRYI